MPNTTEIQSILKSSAKKQDYKGKNTDLYRIGQSWMWEIRSSELQDVWAEESEGAIQGRRRLKP